MSKLVAGYTLIHEHMMIDLSNVKNDLDTCLDCSEDIIAELKECYKYGLRNIVEVTNMGMGRDLKKVAHIEKETGLNILKSTGYYIEPFFPKEVFDLSAQELSDIMVFEIEAGFNDIPDRASLIGEIGSSQNIFTEAEQKVFDAAIIAHKKTGVPISTHTSIGTMLEEQVTYLLDRGVNPQKIIIGHTELSNDIDLIKSILKKGVNIAFDTIGKNSYLPDETRVEFLLELEKEGFIDQVGISMDITRKSHLAINGGLGYMHIFKTFLPMLRAAGFKEESISKILEINSKRIFG